MATISILESEVRHGCRTVEVWLPRGQAADNIRQETAMVLMLLTHLQPARRARTGVLLMARAGPRGVPGFTVRTSTLHGRNQFPGGNDP